MQAALSSPGAARLQQALCFQKHSSRGVHLCRAMPRPMASCRMGQCHIVTPVASMAPTDSLAAHSPGRSTKEMPALPQQGRLLPGPPGLHELLLRLQRRCIPLHPTPTLAPGSRTRLLRPFCTAGAHLPDWLRLHKLLIPPRGRLASMSQA